MLAKDKLWNGSGWYGFIEVISTSTTNISLTARARFFLLVDLRDFFQI